MSGTFMDGGGHDAGHGMHMSHGAEGGFNNGPGHHGNQGAFGAALGHGNHNGGFLSHLLGLDHDAGMHSSHAHAPVTHGASPSQSPVWSSAMQGIKFTDIFQGIKLTANFWLAVMFLAFIGWLFVIYWIRHHEPLANSVIGTGAALSPTAEFDRKMMAHTSSAIPMRTSPTMGSVYTPLPEGQQGAPQADLAAMTSPGAVAAAAPPQMMPVPVMSSVSMMPVGSPQNPAFIPSNFSPSETAPSINVPIYEQSGTRLKTIVGR